MFTIWNIGILVEIKFFFPIPYPITWKEGLIPIPGALRGYFRLFLPPLLLGGKEGP